MVFNVVSQGSQAIENVVVAPFQTMQPLGVNFPSLMVYSVSSYHCLNVLHTVTIQSLSLALVVLSAEDVVDDPSVQLESYFTE